MIGRLNHVAIAVPDVEKAALVYKQILGADVSAPQPLPAHGVTTIFVNLPNSKIELIEPLGADSPIANFLSNHQSGGIHHICYEVEDIITARDKMLAEGAKIAGSSEPKIGAHGKPVLFLHPSSFQGTLIELEQV